MMAASDVQARDDFLDWGLLSIPGPTGLGHWLQRGGSECQQETDSTEADPSVWQRANCDNHNEGEDDGGLELAMGAIP